MIVWPARGFVGLLMIVALWGACFAFVPIPAGSRLPKNSLNLKQWTNQADSSTAPPSSSVGSFSSSPSFTGMDELLCAIRAEHHPLPATSVDDLRQRFGERQSLWGEWSCRQTRRFYREHLPYSLRIDGALGLSLEERALLATEARHALRLYARERCVLPGRILAALYDGVRHIIVHGSWRPVGLTWKELKNKYAREAYATLGGEANDELVALFVYERIVDRACTTNLLLDSLSDANESDFDSDGKSFRVIGVLLEALRKRTTRTCRRLSLSSLPSSQSSHLSALSTVSSSPPAGEYQHGQPKDDAWHANQA
jgi:hypothetical protein